MKHTIGQIVRSALFLLACFTSDSRFVIAATFSTPEAQAQWAMRQAISANDPARIETLATRSPYVYINEPIETARGVQFTYLELAVMEGNVNRPHVEALRALFESGARILQSGRTPYNQTVFHMAASRANAAAIEVLADELNREWAAPKPGDDRTRAPSGWLNETGGTGLNGCTPLAIALISGAASADQRVAAVKALRAVGAVDVSCPGGTGLPPISDNTDRPRFNYHIDTSITDVARCESLCLNHSPRCVGFVVRKPGTGGAGCYLKEYLDTPVPNACCTTGVTIR